MTDAEKKVLDMLADESMAVEVDRGRAVEFFTALDAMRAERMPPGLEQEFEFVARQFFDMNSRYQKMKSELPDSVVRRVVERVRGNR